MPAVTDHNLLAQLNGDTAPRYQAPQVGAPIFTVPQRPEAIAQERRAQEAASRASAQDVREAPLAPLRAQKLQQDINKDKLTEGVPQGAEYSFKSLGFLDKGIYALRQYEKSKTAPRSLVGTAMQVRYPNLTNQLDDPKMQVSEAMKSAFVKAILRAESGAAIPEPELAAYIGDYFPRPGASKDEIDAKRGLRISGLETLYRTAQSAMTPEDRAELRAAIDELKGEQNGFAAPSAGIGVLSRDTPQSYRFSPEQEQEIIRYLQSSSANAQGYADMISGFAQQQGVAVDDAYRQSAMAVGARVIKGLQAGGKLSGEISYQDADEAYIKRLGIPDRSDSGIDAFVRGVADTATLGFADEIAAGGETLFKGGSYRENLARQRGVDRADEEQNGWLRLAGQVGGGFLLPIGGARTAGGLAKVGAAYGGAYGVGSGQGDLGDRLESGLGGAVTGGALGYGVGKVIGKFGGGKPPPSGPSGRDIYEAGQRIGVDALPADIGGPVAGMLTATARATPGGAYSVTSAARRIQDQAMSARDKVAARYGEAQSPVFAGEAAREGALKYRTESRDQIGRLYDRAKQAAGDVKIKPEATLAALDTNISELSQIPGANTALTRLSELRDDIAKRGSLSIDGVRGMRTQLRQDFVKDGLRGSDLERRVNQAIDATVDDIAASLSKAGKGQAASLFKEADTQWRERVETLDKFIMPIIGKQGEKSGEEVFKAIQSASKGNSDRMSRFMQALPDQEFGTVSASLIGALGRNAPGRQNAAGNAFSLETFLTHWNEMSPKAKNFIARGAARSALNDLATYAEGAKRAGSYTNYSNTGLATMTAATGATAFADIGLLGTALAAQAGAGMLLSSPKVASGLARLARAKSPGAKSKAIDSLTQAAVKQPALAPDIIQLQKSLYDAFSQSPGRLAAGYNENNTRVEPPQQ